MGKPSDLNTTLAYQDGAYNTLVQELREDDTSAFKTYFRMDQSCFDELQNLVEPRIARQQT